MKKILALVLVLSLVLGTFSFAFADGHLPEDIVGEDSEDAVATLMALGVVNGYPDGTYKPERTVTRAEMAKLLVEALGYGELAEGATSTFADVQGTWAESYVGFAASMDLVIGYPDGTFRPSQTMTMDEAMTMVIRALGYTDEVLKGTWPTNYKVKALDLELTDDLSTLSGEAARGNVAILLYNALTAELVEVIKDSNGLFTYEYVTYMEDGDEFRKVLLDKIGTKTTRQITYTDVFDDDDALDVADSVDLEDYLYHTVTYYGTDDYDVAYVSDMDTEEFAGVLTATSEDSITVENSDDDMDFDDFLDTDDEDFKLFYNGIELSDETDLFDFAEDETVEAKVIYDEDDVVQGVVVWESAVRMIVSEYTDRRPTQLDGIELPVDSDDDLDMSDLTIEGAVDSLEDIMEDDVVHVYSSEGTDVRRDEDPAKLKLVVVRDTVTGDYTEKDGDTYVIDGVELDVSVYGDADVSYLDDLDNLGNEVKVFLDINGEIFYAEEVDADTAEDYGVYVSKADGSLDQDDFDNVLSVDTAPRIKLFTSDGDVVVYDVYTGDIDLDADDTTAAVADVDLGVIDLDIDSLDSDGTISITGLDLGDKKSIVEYELNSDGELTSITLVGSDYDAADIDDDDMTVDDYDILDNTIVFDVSDPDEDEWVIVDSDYAVDSTGGQIATDDFDIEAMTALGLSDTGSYGIVTNVASYYDGSDTVEKVKALVNGESVTYITNGDNNITLEDQVVSFSFEGDLLDSVADDVDTVTGVAIEINEVDSNRVRVDEGLFSFADDVAVYVVEDEDDWTIESVEYLRDGDYVTLYLDEDGDVIVVVFDIDQEQYMD